MAKAHLDELKKLVVAVSLQSVHHKEVRTKTGWLGFRIMCTSGVACLYSECFRVLEL
jgi:hypothetical protein